MRFSYLPFVSRFLRLLQKSKQAHYLKYLSMTQCLFVRHLTPQRIYWLHNITIRPSAGISSPFRPLGYIVPSHLS